MKTSNVLPHNQFDKPYYPLALYKRSQKLRSILDCNRLLAKLVNSCLMGKIEETRATRIAYILGILMKGFELGGLEKRIENIEKKMEMKANEY